MARRTTNLALCGLAALVAGAGLVGGCRGDRSEKPPRRFLPDMDHQPKWKPQSESEFFADGRVQRMPDPRAVAFSHEAFSPTAYAEAEWATPFLQERADLLKDDDAFYTGRVDGVLVEYMPIEVTAELIEHGQERFNIYCTPCHGYLGDGQGSVGKRWSYAPANLLADPFNDRAQEKGTDGHLFEITRKGLWGPDGANKMPGYEHALSEHDAWAVVAYVRALQTAQNATLDSLTPAERDLLGSAGRAAPDVRATTASTTGGGEL